jgi:hypothetical protein
MEFMSRLKILVAIPAITTMLMLTPCAVDAGEVSTGDGTELYSELSRLPLRARVRLHQNEIKHEGSLASFTSETLTLSQEGRDVNFSIAEITRLDNHKGQAKKGGLIGAAVGLAFAIPMIYSSVNATTDNYGAVTGPMVFVLTTTLGAILGGIDHWVKVYPD